MLATAAIVEAVAAAIEELDLPLVVVDPVMVAKSGDRLLDDDGVQTLCAELLPRALVVTPNIPEAEVLSGMRDPIARRRARGRAADPRAWAASAVDHHGRPRGGRRDRRPAVRRRARSPSSGRRASTRATRTAPAARSRRPSPRTSRSGTRWPTRSARAQQYVAGAIRHGLAIGHGHGPLDHFWQTGKVAGCQLSPADAT